MRQRQYGIALRSTEYRVVTEIFAGTVVISDADDQCVDSALRFAVCG
jgi:hypothetical protein